MRSIPTVDTDMLARVVLMCGWIGGVWTYIRTILFPHPAVFQQAMYMFLTCTCFFPHEEFIHIPSCNKIFYKYFSITDTSGPRPAKYMIGT